MKHKLSITALLLAMFLVTQFIGLFVVIQISNNLPYGLEESSSALGNNGLSLIPSFVLAFALIFLLMKFKLKVIIRIWFLLVIVLALSISLYAILSYFFGMNSQIEIIAFALAVPFAILKTFRRNVYFHNITELLIYPGIATVFIPILSTFGVMVLLVLISIYDMWAVWKSGIMQKMAKFQMEEAKIFGGFLIPTMDEKTKKKIKNIRQKYRGKSIPKSVEEEKYKINLAILGGGDVVFPIITAGVFYIAHGPIAAIMIIMGAFLGLSFLFANTKKGKAYPAMPYISTGIFLSILLHAILF